MSLRFFGLLHVHIIEGINVGHAYAAYRRRRSTASWYRSLFCGMDVRKCGGADPCGAAPDPYVTVNLETGANRQYRLGRTRTINKTTAPIWDDEFTTLVDVSCNDEVFPQNFYTSPTGPNLIVTIYDDDMSGPYNDDLLCSVEVPFQTVCKPGKTVAANLQLRHPLAKASSHSLSQIRVEFRWFPMTNLKDPLGNAVPNVYFKRSHGNRVTLYHDAFCHEEDFPIMALPNSAGVYKAASCWDDIYESINESKQFCLLAGWSVCTAIRLKRAHNEGDEHPETLGELLKRKCEEGVQVVVLIWDDITSLNAPEFLNLKGGIMGTYDEYTRAYFAATKVRVVLAKRNAGDDVGSMLYPLLGALRGTSFTHHQKIVLVDVPNPGKTADEKRVLCAYVGGLDLTSGRYDTSRHELFSTLKTEHHEDFYNGCVADASEKTGPREPWHDIHSRVIGPAAWDVMSTYQERLKRQAPEVHTYITFMLDALIEQRKLRDGKTVIIHPEDTEAWDVQVFRSLDTESAVFTNEKWITRFGAKKLMVDRSIQQAYLYMIDKARQFIFIENQYFLGSAQYWLEHTDTPATHLIPYELTRRICRAIQHGEDFCCYVLTPLYAEGAPASGTVQEILHWQYQTIRMMYSRIGEKLKAVGDNKSHPQDYLQFFFVGKREPNAEVPVSTGKKSAELDNALVNRRHQIYVHSKMMIVDDEYIIIGSANINERSMSGCRDTEIAVGCNQPAHSVTEDSAGELYLPKGDVAAFRLQLWHEHLGTIAPEFERPADRQCTALVKRLAWENWQAWSNPQLTEMRHGHLCTYPLHVRQDGTVEPLPTDPHIPGTEAKVVGVPSNLLPSILTT